MQNTNQIKHYYQNSQWLYRLFCYNTHSLGMHFGFWDSHTKNRQQAVVNQHQAIIDYGHIQKNDRVLDAGCGVGGCAIHIAKETGTHVTGITLVPQQVQLAKQYAKKHRVNHRAHFKTQDYTHTSFPDHSFDVVFGIESICHASPKKTFLKEAYRLLKPRGRLVIADGYLLHPPQNKTEVQLVEDFKKNFALQEFITYQDMTRAIKTAGFQSIQVIDKTQATIPSVNHFYLLGRLTKPICLLAALLPFPQAKAMLWNNISLTTTGEAVKHHLAGYYLHTAVKP